MNNNLNISIESLVNEYLTMKNKIEKQKEKHNKICNKYVNTHKEQVAEKRKELYYRKYASDPEWMKKKTEKNKLYREAKREREGIPTPRRRPKGPWKNKPIEQEQPIII
jgi:hypothetical protein